MASYRKMLKPILYKREEAEQRAHFENAGKTVMISKFNGRSVEGYVRSESRRSRYHRVTISTEGNRIIGGSCSCESLYFYGEPCKHMLRLRNFAVKIGIIR